MGAGPEEAEEEGRLELLDRNTTKGCLMGRGEANHDDNPPAEAATVVESSDLEPKIPFAFGI